MTENKKIHFMELVKKMKNGQSIALEDILNLDITTIPKNVFTDIDMIPDVGHNVSTDIDMIPDVGTIDWSKALYVDKLYDFSTNQKIKEQEKTIKALKDELNLVYLMFERLKEALQEKGTNLQALIGDVASEEELKTKKLTYPDDFEHNSSSLYSMSDEEITNLVREVQEIKVPEGSFYAERIGDVLVLKIHDNEGISIIVSEDYYSVDGLDH